MKIGIDARALETSHRYRGIGTYAYNLFRNLAKLDFDNEYIFFTQKNHGELENINFSEQFNWSNKIIRKTEDPTKYNWFLDQLSLPRAIKSSKVDLVHFLDQLSPPLIKAAKTIITVNDLMQLQGNKKNWKNEIKASPIKYADKIIAISECTKKDIIDRFNISDEKIKVIYDGYDQELFCPNQNQEIIKQIREKFSLRENEQFIFYSGSFEDHEPRKNIDFILDVFHKIHKFYPDLLFLLSGKKGAESDRLMEVAKKSDYDKNIKFIGFLSWEELVGCYQAASAFVFPSLYEGFGLPPLEAMACGVPVISSNTSSLPEVVGDAGILLDPKDANSWVKNIKKILDNKEFAKTLSKKGLIQAKKFSWEKCAKETIKVYKEVINGKN